MFLTGKIFDKKPEGIDNYKEEYCGNTEIGKTVIRDNWIHGC